MAPAVSTPSELFASTSKTVIPDKFSFRQATFPEVLEDLTSRFLLNLPQEEARSLERICFQVEQAHWFYEDFIREENPSLPTMPLRRFCATFFRACPMLQEWSHAHEEAFDKFMEYKTRVPVCGAILLNAACDKCVLVKGWKSSAGWGFPRGKINDGESEPDCAAREVLEETGFDITSRIKDKQLIRLTIKEQRISLFIVHDVPEDTAFQTRTRKEISRIEWFMLADLPTWQKNRTVPGKFYLISPFIGPLKQYLQRLDNPKPRKSKAAKLDLHHAGTPNGHSRVQSVTNHAVVSDDPPTTGSSSQSSVVEPVTPSLLDQLFSKLERPSKAEEPEKGVLAVTDGVIDAFDPHMANLLNKLSGSTDMTPTQSQVGSFQRGPVTPSPSQSDDSVWPSASDSSSSKESPRSDSWGWGPGTTPSPASKGAAISHKLSISVAPNTTNGIHPPDPTSVIYSTSMPATPVGGISRSNGAEHRMLQHLALLESVADESERSTPTRPLLQHAPSLPFYDTQHSGHSLNPSVPNRSQSTVLPHYSTPPPVLAAPASFGLYHPSPNQHSQTMNHLSSSNHGNKNAHNSPFVVQRPPPLPRAYSLSSPVPPAQQQKGHLLSLLSGLQPPPPPAAGPSSFPPLTNPRPIHPPIPITQLQGPQPPRRGSSSDRFSAATFLPRGSNPNLLSILNSNGKPLVTDPNYSVYPTGSPVARR